MEPKRYTVIKFDQLPENGILEYQCVPSSWIKCRHDRRKITVAYPSQDATVAYIEKCIRSGKAPGLKWPLFSAIALTEIDSFTEWPRILSLIFKNHHTYNESDMIAMLNQCDEGDQREQYRYPNEPTCTVLRAIDDFIETDITEIADESFVKESQKPFTSSGQRNESLHSFNYRNIPDRTSGQKLSTIPRNSDYLNETERKKLDGEKFAIESQRPSTSSGQGKSLDRSVTNKKLNESIVETEDPEVSSVPWCSDSDDDEESHRLKKHRNLNKSVGDANRNKNTSRASSDRDEASDRRKENRKLTESIGDANRRKHTPGCSDSDRGEESHQRKENRNLNASIIKSSGPKQSYEAAHSSHDNEFHRNENRNVSGSIGNSSRQKRAAETHLNQEDELRQKYSKKAKSSLLEMSNRIDRNVLNQFKESCEQIILFVEELLTKIEVKK